MTKAKVVSVLMNVSLDCLDSTGEKTLASWFRAGELSYLAKRHKRSTAGWLALKRAVAELLRQVEGRAVNVVEIELYIEDGGRPGIKEIHDWKGGLLKMAVSISHSRTTAYGLASLEVSTDE